MLDSNGSQSMQHNKKYVIKTPLVSRISNNKVDTHRDLRTIPISYLRSCTDKIIPLLLPLKERKMDYLPTERMKKKGKSGSQQVLGKDGEKSMATRILGMVIVMNPPK